MKVKMAQEIRFYLCDECASVHIGLFRNGQLYAEAIPVNPDMVLEDLRLTIAESRLRNAPTSGSAH